MSPIAAQGPYASGTYYEKANGEMGAKLKTALCGIIYDRSERTYKQIWLDFKLTDIAANGCIWDMYSNATNYEHGSSAQGANYNKEGDSYNREHSFPNSWFGGKNAAPMYTDLHHLYPTDGWVNNKRSNYPFGETEGEKYMSENGFSKLGVCTYPGYTDIVFEPADEYKGDFARTYFYMVTCYEEKIVDWYTNYSGSRPTLDGNTYPGLSEWQLDMLLKWSHDDPVSLKEVVRNMAVFDIQHNRNPFIDYPGLEQYIWGKLTNVPFSYDNFPAVVTFDDVDTGIKNIKQDMSISVQEGTLSITSDTEKTLRLFYMNGKVCRQVNINKGVNYIQGLRPGIYLLDNKKIIIP